MTEQELQALRNQLRDESAKVRTAMREMDVLVHALLARFDWLREVERRNQVLEKELRVRSAAA